MLNAVDRFAVIQEQVAQRRPRHAHIVLVKEFEQAIDNRACRGKSAAVVLEVIDELAVFARIERSPQQLKVERNGEDSLIKHRCYVFARHESKRDDCLTGAQASLLLFIY